MRATLGVLGFTSLVAGLACSGTTTAPLLATDGPGSPSSLLGQTRVSGGTAEYAAARYAITVDPVAETASAAFVESRGGAATDDQYLLSIEEFMGPETLRVTSVRSLPTTFELNLLFSHPFPAPADLDAPATALNRADLGVTGRVLFLLDVPSAAGNTYFAGDAPVIAETTLCANPDGYYKPAGLLNPTGLIADTFPYVTLVDEVADSRIGVSNGGLTTGNYDPTSGGWQRDNIGPNRDGWTGYGAWHQGQRDRKALEVQKAGLQAGARFTFDAVIIVKYTDPRGGTNGPERRANRLPANPFDVDRFVYRMPYGALDVERIEFLGEDGGFTANQTTSSRLHFRVTDADARATESPGSDLGVDPIVTNVQQGTSGVPGLAVSIPGVLGLSTIEAFAPGDQLPDDSGFPGGDPEEDSGLQGDGLYYTREVFKPINPGELPGTHTGLVRARDVEADLDTSDFVTPLDPTLNPLTSGLPQPISYQAFQVALAPDANAPSGDFVVLTDPILDGDGIVLKGSNFADLDSDDIDVLVDWNDTGSFIFATTVSAPYPVAIKLPSPGTYAYAGGTDIRDVPIRLDDGTSVVTITPAPTFEIVDACPAAPYVATDVLTNWSNSPRHFGLAWGGMTAANHDYAAYTEPTIGGQRSGAAVQNYIGGTSYDIIRAYPGALVSDPWTVVPLTTGAAALANKQVFQIEIDSTRRIVFSTGNTGYVSSNSSPIEIYNNAAANFSWFDSDGQTAVASADVHTVSTGTARIIALALAQNNDVYLIDQDHILHRYLNFGPDYSEDVVSGVYPLDLKPVIGANTGVGAANRKVHDFVIDWYNQAFFVLTEFGVDSALNDGFIHRIECDGSFNPNLNGPGTNPVVFTLTDFFQFVRGGDITIDQHDSTGAFLGAQADAQIRTSSFTSGPPDRWIFNALLEATAPGVRSLGGQRHAVLADGREVSKNGNGPGYTFLQTPPASWQ